MGYIYLITNRVTGKRYVGQTIHEDIETRWNQHRRVCENMLGRHICAAYKKYGVQNFEFTIICVCFDEACNELEENYITKFNTLAPNGYNLRAGGNNSKHSEESKKLMSQNRKGKGLGCITEEICKQRSERFKGENNPNFGKSLTNDQKIKISEKMKQIWEEKKKNGYTNSPRLLAALAEGRRKRIEEARLRNSNKPELKGRKQRVAKLDDLGNILEEFDSITDAASKTKLQSTKISMVCRGERITTGGFKWKYLDIEGNSLKRNTSTGELYISKYGSGYVIRISKKTFKRQTWFKTLEEAIVERDKYIKELDELS